MAVELKTVSWMKVALPVKPVSLQYKGMQLFLSHLLTAIVSVALFSSAAYTFLIKSDSIGSMGSEVQLNVTEEDLKSLKDKVVLVTGASSGIGFQIAKKAAEFGAKLSLTDIDIPPSETLKGQILKNGGSAIAIKADLRIEGDRKRIVDETIEAFGTVDVLINNAGYLYVAKPEEMDNKEVRDSFEVLLFSNIDLVRQVLPFMKKSGEGHIVNISSILGHYPELSSLGHRGLNSIYTSGKAAVVAWSQVMKNALKEHNIKVTLVSPAGVSTPFWENARGPQKKEAQSQAKQNKMFFDTPELIAKEALLGMKSDQFLILPGNASGLVRMLKEKGQIE